MRAKYGSAGLAAGAVGILALWIGGTHAVSQTRPAAIRIDGSSTVYPISAAVAKAYASTPAGRTTPIDIQFSGTGGGFRKFCAGKTDISNASRPISDQEEAQCRQAKVGYVELPVALDALTVVVHPSNTWASAITVAELRRIWEPAAQGKINTWQQVRSTWPNRPLKLYGPGRDSGTFDYFTEATMGKAGASRTDYVASEDDNVLVKGVSTDPNSLGYFGLAYYEANPKDLKALGIDSGRGSVMPTRSNVEQDRYHPYGRPLYIYVSTKALRENPALRPFVTFYLNQASTMATKVGYIPLPAAESQLTLATFAKAR
ncbi:MAG: PstS family phosphate ABC transporter substrate-binding protein [Gloeomargaritaceae cyanobacterium C42_A2020_066]|nr:PstS family phosphate ABC transporter substrate-binding protein [Gloeomargaritaceae cyanobacterium C42_A2020_066]